MGYFMHRGEDVFLIIDGGPVGPAHLLAHAHADIFSYELSLANKQVVVDSGVFEYPAGPMRRYVRSTMAHNTVSIDGLDQVECWGSFRVARRFAPHDVSFSTEAGSSIFTGSYSGYADLVGDDILHHRQIKVDETSRTISVRDRVDGYGRHAVESRVHLHPELDVLQKSTKSILHYYAGAFEVEVRSTPNSWEDSWYCPRFGMKLQNKVLVCKTGTLPSQILYQLQY
jgi:uncharacterized heparinase superfamily protein